MPDEPRRADPLEFTLRWPVRGYELDSLGHVNNAVYLSWAEELATAHAEAAGYGRDWSAGRGGGWIVRKTEITYHRPAVYGDEVELTVRVELVRGARGVRRTTIHRVPHRAPLARALTHGAGVRGEERTPGGGRRRGAPRGPPPGLPRGAGAAPPPPRRAPQPTPRRVAPPVTAAPVRPMAPPPTSGPPQDAAPVQLRHDEA